MFCTCKSPFSHAEERPWGPFILDPLLIAYFHHCLNPCKTTPAYTFVRRARMFLSQMCSQKHASCLLFISCLYPFLNLEYVFSTFNSFVHHFAFFLSCCSSKCASFTCPISLHLCLNYQLQRNTILHIKKCNATQILCYSF